MWLAYRLPPRITLGPYPLYLAGVVGKPGATRWRCDKPGGCAAVVRSPLIALLAMPEFNLPTLEWVGMSALPPGAVSDFQTQPLIPLRFDPIEREDDGARPEVGWAPLETDEGPIPLFPWKVRETVHQKGLDLGRLEVKTG